VRREEEEEEKKKEADYGRFKGDAMRVMMVEEERRAFRQVNLYTTYTRHAGFSSTIESCQHLMILQWHSSLDENTLIR